MSCLDFLSIEWSKMYASNNSHPLFTPTLALPRLRRVNGARGCHGRFRGRSQALSHSEKGSVKLRRGKR